MDGKRRAALQVVIRTGEISRLAAMVLAELRPELRPLVLPIRDPSELTYLFERGLLGLYGEVVRLERTESALPSDLMTSLGAGHFEFSDWVMMNTPAPRDEFLSYLFLERGSIFRFAPNARMTSWIEKNFDVGSILMDWVEAEEHWGPEQGQVIWDAWMAALDEYINTADFDPRVASWFARATGHYTSDTVDLFDGERFTPRAVAWLVHEGYIPKRGGSPLKRELNTIFAMEDLFAVLGDIIEKGGSASEALYAREGRVANILRIIGILYEAEDLKPDDLMDVFVRLRWPYRAVRELFPDEGSRRRLVARILALRGGN